MKRVLISDIPSFLSSHVSILLEAFDRYRSYYAAVSDRLSPGLYSVRGRQAL